jgi:hypothetical protein
MIKILYWNVENFGISKINDTRSLGKKRPIDEGEAQAMMQRMLQNSKDRLDFILDTMRQNDGAMLDIFVLVENLAGGSNIGALINGDGVQGAVDLLEEIRAKLTIGTRQDQWKLVPPLLLTSGTTKEGISVFFNSATLDFTGPYGWGGQQSQPNGTFVAYIKNFKNALPTTKVSDNAAYNAGLAQNTLAGQVTFSKAGKEVGFPVKTKDRAPLLTTFWDKSGSRNIKLLSYHAPKPTNEPSKGIRNLANIPEMTTALGDNEVGIIVGDFNVNAFDTDLCDYAYGPLTTKAPIGQQYKKHITDAGLTSFPGKSYLCTTMYAANIAPSIRPGPWGNLTYGVEHTNWGYPGYEYTTENSYDNILTRYGKNMVAPGDFKITIVNRVTGTPYNRLNPPTDNAPIGSFIYTSAMKDGNDQNATIPVLPLPPQHAGPDNQGGYSLSALDANGLYTNFNLWENYAKIRSTSDHIPLLIQV